MPSSPGSRRATDGRIVRRVSCRSRSRRRGRRGRSLAGSRGRDRCVLRASRTAYQPHRAFCDRGALDASEAIKVLVWTLRGTPSEQHDGQKGEKELHGSVAASRDVSPVRVHPAAGVRAPKPRRGQAQGSSPVVIAPRIVSGVVVLHGKSHGRADRRTRRVDNRKAEADSGGKKEADAEGKVLHG